MAGLLGASGFTFQVTPNPGGAPGGAGVQSAIDVIAAYALYASAAGFLLGAAIWAVGGRIGNDYTSTGGKVGLREFRDYLEYVEIETTAMHARGLSVKQAAR